MPSKIQKLEIAIKQELKSKDRKANMPKQTGLLGHVGNQFGEHNLTAEASSSHMAVSDPTPHKQSDNQLPLPAEDSGSRLVTSSSQMVVFNQPYGAVDSPNR